MRLFFIPKIRTINHRARRNGRPHARGQNLVELALTFPFVLVMLFFIVEMGRLWFTYEGAKTLALEGAHTAAIYHSHLIAQTHMNEKRLAMHLILRPGSSITQITNRHAYKATVVVGYSPLFNVQMPTLGGQSVTLLPSIFDITYTAVADAAIY